MLAYPFYNRDYLRLAMKINNITNIYSKRNILCEIFELTEIELACYYLENFSNT